MSEYPTEAQEREGCGQGEQDLNLDLPNEGAHREGGEEEEGHDDNEEEERSPRHVGVGEEWSTHDVGCVPVIGRPSGTRTCQPPKVTRSKWDP
jgi:hypothetical protein